MKWNFINLTAFKQFNWIGSVACSADDKMSKNRYIPEFFFKKKQNRMQRSAKRGVIFRKRNNL